MDLQLKGKTAFISGSTQGIGFAAAKLLLQEGATVIINGRSEARVKEAVQKLKDLVPNGPVSGVAADFTKLDDVQQLMDKLPSVDILVNNAGIFEPKAFEDIPDEDWYRFFEVNVMSGVRLSRHFFPKMIANNWGRIIFISSESSIMIPSEMIHYGMTKTAQLAVSRGLAERTKNTGVTVNTILPGPTKSEGVLEFLAKLATEQGVSPEEAEKNFFKDMRPSSLIQRFADVSEIASMIAYVASPLSAATNGAAIRVEGGLVPTIY